MCTGAAVPIALSVAGAGASTLAAINQQKAAAAQAARQRDLAAQQLAVQQALDNQKFNEVMDVLPIADRETQQENIDNATQQLRQEFSANVQDPSRADTNYAPTAHSTPQVIQSANDRSSKAASDLLSALGDARARLGAWQEGMFDFGQGLQDTQNNLRFLQNESNRQAQLGQNAQQLAGMDDGGSLWNTALGAAGQIGSLYGGYKMGQNSVNSMNGIGFRTPTTPLSFLGQ